MNVATITMDPAQAREKLREYRTRKHDAADREYQRAETAFKALAKGTRLLMLSDAFDTAPLDAKQRPRLAIARADKRQVQLFCWSGEPAYRFNASTGRERAADLDIVVRPTHGPDSTWTPRERAAWGYALVPMVPPAVRGNRSLATHFVLWEVERWADERLRATSDLDPYLLRRIADDLFAVVGEWDLTDVERAVMRDRRRG